MVPLITLFVATLAARLAGWLGWDYANGWPAAVAVGLAAMFVVTGAAHFVQPLRGDMIAIVPPRLPAPSLLVSITGVLELLGAIGLLLPAGSSSVPLRADAGHVPGEPVRRPEGRCAEVHGHTVRPVDRRGDRLPGCRRASRAWRGR